MEGLRAVAMRRWDGLEATRVARDWPIPDEHPVTGLLVDLCVT